MPWEEEEVLLLRFQQIKFLAVMIFNEGFSWFLQTVEVMGITLHSHAGTYAARLDEKGIDRFECGVKDTIKRAWHEQRVRKPA